MGRLSYILAYQLWSIRKRKQLAWIPGFIIHARLFGEVNMKEEQGEIGKILDTELQVGAKGNKW